MKYLYLLRQYENSGYDTYDSCIVCAESEDEAKRIHPSNYSTWQDNYRNWAYSPESVLVELIGTAVDTLETGVVIASFNAG